MITPKEDTSVTMTIRIDRSLQEEYNHLASRTNCSRNELICMALQYAFDNMELKSPDDSDAQDVKHKKFKMYETIMDKGGKEEENENNPFERNRRMTYTQAVEKALCEDASGFEFLYNSTKNRKYYLALKYVADEETAKDVLQEAYIKAWMKLDRLKDPEKFDSWLAQIVVNTAKNELEKRRHTPLDLRADVGEGEDQLEILDRTVDSWENIPELEYTREETRQLVRELIASLPDEQRLALIAFEIEGLTAKQIAEQLDCSEGTVKSRILYARKNIKKKAEELQKKGYGLSGIAPAALLVFLLQKDMEIYAAEPATQLALSRCEENALRSARSFVRLHEAAGKDTAKIYEKETHTKDEGG